MFYDDHNIDEQYQNLRKLLLETEGDYCVEAELAGINQNNIDVKLENNILTIKGKKVLENENKENDVRQITFNSSK